MTFPSGIGSFGLFALASSCIVSSHPHPSALTTPMAPLAKLQPHGASLSSLSIGTFLEPYPPSALSPPPLCAGGMSGQAGAALGGAAAGAAAAGSSSLWMQATSSPLVLDLVGLQVEMCVVVEEDLCGMPGLGGGGMSNCIVFLVLCVF